MQKKLPSTAILWKTDITPGGTFYITSDKLRTKYTLWREGESGVDKVKTAATPDKFNATLEPYWNPASSDKSKRKRSGKK